jgi:hypothetical protein
MLPRLTPSISTNSDVVPWLFVVVQGGPGETQPGGVGPGVNQRFAVPTGEVVPGLKALFDKELEPVILSVISVILTVTGAQSTLGFQEPTGMNLVATPAFPTESVTESFTVKFCG